MGCGPDIGPAAARRYLWQVRLDTGSPPRAQKTTYDPRRPMGAAGSIPAAPMAVRGPDRVAILFEVNPDRLQGESTVSVSGSEYVRRIKAQIDEIDPSSVRELAGEGVALIDVRESGEWDSGHLPGAKHVP